MKKIIVLIFCMISINLSFSDEILTVATTTSVYDSEILDILVSAFEKKYNCKIKIIPVGTGQAIRLAKDGNVDMVLVHDKELEEEFIRNGFGKKRYPVMFNYFVIVGPKSDPAGVKSSKNVVECFKKISDKRSYFVSRGDNSGTHRKEISIWKKISGVKFSNWYIESGSGMVHTLRIANEKGAYCFSDLSTWITHKNELDNLCLLFEKDPALLNEYSLIPVSPEKFRQVNFELAEKFVEFFTSKEGQKLISDFGKKKYGQPVFYPISIR
jgi:tungstate transport system substrate-binding protein